jgi:hypothetical protein
LDRGVPAGAKLTNEQYDAFKDGKLCPPARVLLSAARRFRQFIVPVRGPSRAADSHLFYRVGNSCRADSLRSVLSDEAPDLL